VTAHAVGNEKKLRLVGNEERILVVLTLAPYVGDSYRFEIHR
jgi:hypothetical protein